MITVRVAVPDDAPELVRLRGVLFDELDGHSPLAGAWQEHAERTLRQRLATPPASSTWAGFVVDRPGGSGGLAACAVAAIEYRLGEPANPSGATGYVFNVATDPDYRRRGYSRACLDAVLDWYRERGVSRAELKASPAGEPLYRSLGFTDSTMTALKLTIKD